MRNSVHLPAPVLGISQSPLTPAPGDLIASLGLSGYPHTQRQTQININKILTLDNELIETKIGKYYIHNTLQKFYRQAKPKRCKQLSRKLLDTLKHIECPLKAGNTSVHVLELILWKCYVFKSNLQTHVDNVICINTPMAVKEPAKQP